MRAPGRVAGEESDMDSKGGVVIGGPTNRHPALVPERFVCERRWDRGESSDWSGWTESNRRYLFGREEFYH